MKNILLLLLMLPVLSLGQTSGNIQDMELEALNEFLFTEYALYKNTKPFSDMATEDFILVAAPGMIETKQQAIEGVKNLNISSLNVIVDKTIETEDIGIVVGVLEMKGTIMNRPVPEKIRFSSTFIKENGKWRLIARTMTPMRMK